MNVIQWTIYTGVHNTVPFEYTGTARSISLFWLYTEDMIFFPIAQVPLEDSAETYCASTTTCSKRGALHSEAFQHFITLDVPDIVLSTRWQHLLSPPPRQTQDAIWCTSCACTLLRRGGGQVCKSPFHFGFPFQKLITATSATCMSGDASDSKYRRASWDTLDWKRSWAPLTIPGKHQIWFMETQ